MIYKINMERNPTTWCEILTKLVNCPLFTCALVQPTKNPIWKNLEDIGLTSAWTTNSNLNLMIYFSTSLHSITFAPLLPIFQVHEPSTHVRVWKEGEAQITQVKAKLIWTFLVSSDFGSKYTNSNIHDLMLLVCAAEKNNTISVSTISEPVGNFSRRSTKVNNTLQIGLAWTRGNFSRDDNFPWRGSGYV